MKRAADDDAEQPPAAKEAKLTPSKAEGFSKQQLTTGDESIKKFLELTCFHGLHEIPAQEAQEGAPERAALHAPGNKSWESGKVLKVSFRKEKMPAEKYCNDFINSRTIIEWMNEWSKGSSPVPRFEEVERFEDGDIRIDFGAASWSYIGTDAKSIVDRTKCTMMLNICVQPESYKKYTVLHETGHSLGFGHEHQHPKCDYTFNEDVVINALTNNFQQVWNSTDQSTKTPREKAEEFYNINYRKPTDDKNSWQSDFDPNSVMKYGAPRAWINPSYFSYYYSGDKDYLWPLSARTGCLSDLDKKNAKYFYERACSRTTVETDGAEGTPQLPSQLLSIQIEEKVEANGAAKQANGATKQNKQRSSPESKSKGRDSDAMTRHLEIKDHNEVLTLLRDKLVNQQIVALGEELGLSLVKLRNADPEKLLDDMILWWLRKDGKVLKKYGRPSIATLVQVLEKLDIGIYDDIRQKYGDEI